QTAPGASGPGAPWPAAASGPAPSGPGAFGPSPFGPNPLGPAPSGANASRPGGPPNGVQCNDFNAISAEAQKRGSAVGDAVKAHAEHKQVCALMTTFVAAETKVVKFLEDNKLFCGIPDQVITNAKANHEKSLKFRTVACTEEPKPKAQTLSD